jgi:uncharacterized membrane protein YqjE
MLRIGELGDAGRFVIDQFETYLDLAHAEISAQRRATVRRAAWLAAGSAAALLGLWFLLVAILIASWDTPYRMNVVIAIPLALFLLALAAFLIASRAPVGRGWLRLRHELRQDLVALREILWTRG